RLHFSACILFEEDSNHLTMKTRSLVLTGAFALTLGACATWGLFHRGVDIDESFIQIHPGTKITPEDQAKLDQILSQYKTKLYKIKNNVNGNLMPAKGHLNNLYIEQSFLAEVAQAETNGVPYSALQIGAAGNAEHAPVPDHAPRPDLAPSPDHAPVPDHAPRPEHAPRPDHAPVPDHAPRPDLLSREDFRKCTELVKRVTPILKK